MHEFAFTVSLVLTEASDVSKSSNCVDQTSAAIDLKLAADAGDVDLQ